MDKLQLKNDVKAWHIEAITAIQELFDSKCTIMDYALMCVMKSLAGKSKTIQYKVADDINNNTITDATNVFDMIQGYSAAMASVGVDKVHSANYTAEEKAAYKKKKEESEKKKRIAEEKEKKKKLKCTFCGKMGHLAEHCFRNPQSPKYKGSPKAATAQAETTNVQQTSNTSTDNQLTAAELLAMLVKLNGGTSMMVKSLVAVAPQPEDSISVKDGIWMSLCGGLNCLAYHAKEFKISPSRFISVETDKKVSALSQATHPETEHFCGIDDQWKQQSHRRRRSLVV